LLVAEGDPRGELIQLQSALESGRGGKTKLAARIKSLLKAYERKWLDGLDAMVRDPVFRAGFAQAVTLNKNLDPTVRAWRTVDTLRFADLSHLAEAETLMHENLAGITRVMGIPTWALMGWLSRCGDRRFETVFARGSLTDNVHSCEAHIHHLSLRGGSRRSEPYARHPYRDAFAWYERSALKDHVDILELDGEDVLSEAIADLGRNPSLAEIWLRPEAHTSWGDACDFGPIHWDVRVSRDESGVPTVIDALWHAQLGRVLAQLPDDALTRIVVRNAEPVDPAVQLERDRSIADAVSKQRRLN
jgi:hypothetical protein